MVSGRHAIPYHLLTYYFGKQAEMMQHSEAGRHIPCYMHFQWQIGVEEDVDTQCLWKLNDAEDCEDDILQRLTSIWLCNNIFKAGRDTGRCPLLGMTHFFDRDDAAKLCCIISVKKVMKVMKVQYGLHRLVVVAAKAGNIDVARKKLS